MLDLIPILQARSSGLALQLKKSQKWIGTMIAPWRSILRRGLLVLGVLRIKRGIFSLFCSFIKSISCLCSGLFAWFEAFRAFDFLVSWREWFGNRRGKEFTTLKSSLLVQNVLSTDDPIAITVYFGSEFHEQFCFKFKGNAL